MKRKKTKDECTLVPWSEAVQERLAKLPPISEARRQEIAAAAKETTRQVVEAVEQQRLWIKENMSEHWSANGIEALTMEAESQWNAIRVYDDPMAIQVLKSDVFDERIERLSGNISSYFAGFYAATR